MKVSIMLLILVIVCIPWVVNFVKFTNCDFESDFKCEVIHGSGVFIPPAAYITVWFDSDASK